MAKLLTAETRFVFVPKPPFATVKTGMPLQHRPTFFVRRCVPLAAA
jgi:hypothetical protein